MKRNKITAVILSIVMSMSMMMPSFEVMADETSAPSETQKTESTENETSKSTEKPTKTTESPNETKNVEPSETKKQKTVETTVPSETTKITENNEPSETSKLTETTEPSGSSKPTETTVEETSVPAETTAPKETDKTSETSDSEEKTVEARIPSQKVSSSKKNAVVSSGSCGAELNWEYDSDKYKLTISGNGEMTNWNSSEEVPWKDYASSIKILSISKTVSSIGSYAFYNCSKLIEAYFPDKVISIGDKAFCGCTSLNYVLMNKDSYNENAFTGLSGVRFVYFYDVKYGSDGNGTVSGATRSYLNDVNHITLTPNEGYKIDSVTISSNTGGFRYNPTGSFDYTMPNTTTNVSVYATFVPKNTVDHGSCGNTMTWLLDDKGVLTIAGSGNMEKWSNSGDVPWRNHTGSIYSVVFSGDITSITGTAFYRCKYIKSITIPKGVTSIGRYTFGLCESLESIELHDNITFIDAYAFTGCSSLKSIKIPDKVTSIGEQAFSACTSLTSVVLNKKAYSKEAFPNKPSEIFHYYFDVSYSNDGNGTISGKTRSYGTDVIEFSVTPQKNYLADKVTISYADKDVKLSPDSNGKFTSTMLDSDDVVFVSAAFRSKDSEGSCGDNMTWVLDTEGTLKISGSGNMTSSPWLRYSDSIKSVIISGDVTSIVKGAFYACKKLKSISIPNSTTTIGEGAFEECSSLERITLPFGVRVIPARAFYCCSSLDSFTIPTSVTTLGKEAFYGCEKLENISIPSSVTSIGELAFQYCRGLTSVSILGSAVSIGDSAFECCQSLSSVNLSNGVTSIGDYAFSCSGITNISIPKSVNKIGNYAFNECTSLEKVTIADGVSSIGSRAFFYCTKLSNISLPNSVTSIGECAFLRCEGLTTVTLSTGLTSIAVEAFSHCESLENIIIPSGVKTIGRDAFSYCYKLKGVYFPESITSIGNAAFASCYALTSVAIPNGVTTIGVMTFSCCSTLKSVTIPISVKTIEGGAFDYCSNLKDVYYSGTYNDWRKISIGTNNDPLDNVSFHFGQGPSQLFAITVNDGSSDVATAASGATVTITASEAPANMMFDKWIIVSGTVTLDDEASEIATFTMPAENVVISATYKDKAENTLSVKGKTAKVKYKKLRKKAQTVGRSKVMTVSNAQGKIAYSLATVKRGKSTKYKKYFKINATTGNVTVKKKLKKGTYTITCKVTATGDVEHKGATKTVTFKIKVK